MDAVHPHEIKIVALLQHYLMDFKDPLMFISHFGSPDNAFMLYFPVAYFLNKAIGLKILWAAVFSEWFNAALKWLMFGHRPYWWVRESTMYNNQNRPDIEQFPSTCETGPGSPSGHLMVTAAVWFIIIKGIITHRRSSKKESGGPSLVDVFLWALFAIFIVSIGVSRVFIATHFPNQVVLGLVIGLFIGRVVSDLPVHTFNLFNYMTGAMFLFQAVFYQYLIMNLMGLRPDWSIALASKWCADKAWVHLNTRPMYSVARDIGILFFTGMAERYIGVEGTSRGLAINAALAVSVAYIVHIFNFVTLPTKHEFLFYFLGMFKEGLVPLIVIGLHTLYEKVFGKVKVV